jgi:hypothetical protein
MSAIIVALLVLLIFLVACDKDFMNGVGRMIGVQSRGGYHSGFSAADQTSEPVQDPFDKLAPVETFLNTRTGPPSWEPSIADFSKLGADDIFKDYASDLKANVDAAIIESHREYTSDTDFLATTGASHASARDDFMPPVQFHGLPRSALYANLGSESTSRVSQSETPEEVRNIEGGVSSQHYTL